MVLFEQGKPKGDASAKKSILSEEVANKILSTSGNVTIKRKEDGEKYEILERRLFEYKQANGETVLFIICDCKK